MNTVQTDRTLAVHGAQTIAKGSKSFALASLLFGRDMQTDVHMLYAWCRRCDDVIDGQDLGGDAPDGDMSQAEMARRLDGLRDKTGMALAGKVTGDHAFDGFSLVARKHDIPDRYPMDLLDGFASDVRGTRFESLDDLMIYCYGVAGVVGVMMAIIMGIDKDDEETLDRACDLGLAFQLTNICRDVVADANAGRVYLPASWLRARSIGPEPEAVLDENNRAALSHVVADILSEADRYYASAGQGARRLPFRAAAAVLAARNVYREIGKQVIHRGAHAWDTRTGVSRFRKITLAAAGAGAGAMQAIFRLSSRQLDPRGPLWRRSVMPVRRAG
ncbi:phytoene/squalene synthase family protein [Hyphococcus sp.]|uniref:phytoene/squalene synthase family protein n=1 Tax=Hyphococcus sp. TaxID=2038636 RepID=UPI003CCBD4AE